MPARIVLLMLLLTAIQSASAATPAHSGFTLVQPDFITRCDAPVEFRDRHQYVGIDIVGGSTFDSTLELTLIRQADASYDVLAGGDSVAATGDLSRMPTGDNPVHLVLNTGAGIEHFLFVLNPDGSGELLWSSATASALTTCTASI